MGIAESGVDFNSFLANCCMNDKSQDDAYWPELIKHVWDRSELKMPNPRLMDEIATRYPNNLLRLFRECVNFMEYIMNAESAEIFPKIIFNQVSEILYTFTCAVISCTTNPNHIDYYNYVLGFDSKVYDEMTEEQRNAEKSKPSLLSRYLTAVYKLFFKPGLAVKKDQKIWGVYPEDPTTMILLRYDLVTSLLMLMNIDTISMKQIQKINFNIDTPFPSEQFLRSVLNISKYSDRIANEKMTMQYIQSSIIFCLSASFWNREFIQKLSNINPQEIVLSFAGSTNLPFPRKPNFTSTSLLASEFLSMCYLCCLWNRNFITYMAKNQISNAFIYELLSLSQFTFESIGLTVVHTIILSLIDILLLEETALLGLNESFTGNFDCTFRPHRGNYCDILLEFILNISAKETNSLICRIIKRMLPTANFSVSSCYKLFKFFPAQLETDQLTMLLEGFAGVVLKNKEETINTRVFIIQKIGVIKKISIESTKPLEQITSYANNFLPKFGKQKVSFDDAIAIINSVKIPQSNEIYETNHLMVNMRIWKEWSELLFIKANNKSVQKYREIDLNYQAPIEVKD